MDLLLNNKVVLVTGGAGRKGSIGETFVRALAEEGAIPAFIDTHEERGKALQEELRLQGKEACFVAADLRKPAPCEWAISYIQEQYGRIDGIINNAGGNDMVGLDASYEEFVASLHANLIHMFLVVKYSLPALIRSQGTIVNIGSKVAVLGQGGTSAYAAAKAGVMGLTREWALDLSRHNIRVNTLMIAEAWTPSYEDWIQSLPHPQVTLQSIQQSIPLGSRLTQVGEIADLALFLLSPKSGHITGQHIYTDGGYTHLDRNMLNRR